MLFGLRFPVMLWFRVGPCRRIAIIEVKYGHLDHPNIGDERWRGTDSICIRNPCLHVSCCIESCLLVAGRFIPLIYVSRQMIYVSVFLLVYTWNYVHNLFSLYLVCLFRCIWDVGVCMCSAFRFKYDVMASHVHTALTQIRPCVMFLRAGGLIIEVNLGYYYSGGLVL